MKLFWMIAILIVVFLFNFNLKPLESLPSEVFSYVWSAIILIKIIDIGYTYFTKEKIKIFKSIDPFLIGLLIGTVIASVKWTPFSGQLITNLVFVLSPLFLFFTNKESV